MPLEESVAYNKEKIQDLNTLQMNRRQRQTTKRLKKDTRAVLKAKLAEMILLREDIDMQENFAIDLAEKKEAIQQLIDVSHQIQALKVVIGLFTEKK